MNLEKPSIGPYPKPDESNVHLTLFLQIFLHMFANASRRYQSFCEVLGLERGPLSLVSTIEELLERKNSGSGLETEITAVGDPRR
jgi:hypothetical protein